MIWRNYDGIVKAMGLSHALGGRMATAVIGQCNGQIGHESSFVCVDFRHGIYIYLLDHDNLWHLGHIWMVCITKSQSDMVQRVRSGLREERIPSQRNNQCKMADEKSHQYSLQWMDMVSSSNDHCWSFLLWALMVPGISWNWSEAMRGMISFIWTQRLNLFEWSYCDSDTKWMWNLMHCKKTILELHNFWYMTLGNALLSALSDQERRSLYLACCREYRRAGS